MSVTPTLLRLKRRKNEDPSDVLVLSSKKRKTESDSSDGESEIKILKLAATIDAKDSGLKLTETVNNILSKKNYPNFEELKEKYKKSVSSPSSKSVSFEVKNKISCSRTDHRYRLVAQKRSLKVEDLEDWPDDEPEIKAPKSDEATPDKDKELFHLFDVVSDADTKNSDDKCDKPDTEKISCNGVEMIREYVATQK